MEFVDGVLVRLATPDQRAMLFDDMALQQIAAAAYRTDALALGAPFSAVFDQLTIAAALDEPIAGQIHWQLPGIAQPGDARLDIAGWRNGGGLAVDAIWRGAVVGRAKPPSGRISKVLSAFPSLASVDAAIVANHGALPADPAEREQKRRAQLVSLLVAASNDPAIVTEDLLDRWLRDTGADSVSELLTTHLGTVHAGLLQLTFEDLAPAQPVPTFLPVAAAILIRDPTALGFRLSALLGETKRIQQLLQSIGVAARAPDALPQRHASIVVWLVRDTWFDDDGWPGAQQGANAAARRAQRRAAAGAWLAEEGIGLATVAAAPP